MQWGRDANEGTPPIRIIRLWAAKAIKREAEKRLRLNLQKTGKRW